MKTTADTPAPSTSAKARGLRTGELLVKAGLATPGQVDRALMIQKTEALEKAEPFGRLLLLKSMISAEQLDLLLHHPDRRRRIGEMTLQAGWISMAELDACLQLKRPADLTGQLLLRRGAVDQKQLARLLKVQASGVKIGELALNLGMIDESQLERALRIKSGPRAIGEILSEQGLVRAEALKRILLKNGKQLRLGQVLVRQGILGAEQLRAALREQQRANLKLGQILIRQHMLDEEQLAAALARQFTIAFRSLRSIKFDSRQRRMLGSAVGEQYARAHELLPLRIESGLLQVGLADPANLKGAEELAHMYTDLRVEPVLITAQSFSALFDRLYKSPDTPRPKGDAGPDLTVSDLDPSEEEAFLAAWSCAAAAEPSAEEVVTFIIRNGIRMGASDIHLEQDRQGFRLRYRVDGFCREMESDRFNDHLQEISSAVISRIKVLSGLDIAEKRMPQDGVFRVACHDRRTDRRRDLDLRVATCPAIKGENAAIRILDSRNAQVGIDQLDHPDHVLTPLKRMLRSSAGMLLVSGPTGSGKSSTLYAALRHIYHPGIKIITAEDPIEYSIPGIMQTQVKPKIGLNFARLLRSFLRMDPDVVLVGEIRDPETAAIAFDAAQTGHLLLSTLHTNDAVSALPRLLDLGIEHNQIAAGVIGVLAQRLVRRLCVKCKRPCRPPRAEWELFFDSYPEQLPFHRSVGCAGCGYTGYRGRTLISELFEPDRDICVALGRGANKTELKQMALRSGMKTMIDDGLMKLDQTTLSEIIRVVPLEMMKDFSQQRQSGAKPGLPPSVPSSGPAPKIEHNGNPGQAEALRELNEALQAIAAELGSIRRLLSSSGATRASRHPALLEGE